MKKKCVVVMMALMPLCLAGQFKVHTVNHQETTVEQTAALVNPVDPVKKIANSLVSPSPIQQVAVALSTAHKTTVLSALCCAAYLGLLAHMLYKEHCMATNSTWSLWKQGVPLATLVTYDQKQLARELFGEIQRRHIPSEQAATFLDPIIQFVQECDKELHQLQTFVALREWLARVHITLLFPTQEYALSVAHDKIERLRFLKQLFVGWVSEYRVEPHA